MERSYYFRAETLAIDGGMHFLLNYAAMSRGIHFSRLFLGVLLLFLASGCQESESRAPGIYVSDVSRAYAELGDKDVMVSVNGVGLTKADFTSLYRLRQQLFSLQRDGRLLSVTSDEAMPEMAASLVLELIHHELFRQYAERKGLSPSPEQVARSAKDFLRAIKHRENEDLRRIAASMEEQVRERFLAIPFEDARDHLLRQSVTTNDLDTVSEAEVAARERFVKAFDEDADRYNQGQRRKLAEARRQILGGREFNDVTREIAEVSPEHGARWATVELGELPPDEDLCNWLKKAKVGDVSEPLDLPDGLGIVKLVSMGKGEAPKGVPPPDTYVLVKCTLFAHERMRYQDPQQMRRQLLLWKREDAQKKLGTMLYGEAVIEYPNGTSFFPEFDKAYNESIRRPEK